MMVGLIALLLAIGASFGVGFGCGFSYLVFGCGFGFRGIIARCFAGFGYCFVLKVLWCFSGVLVLILLALVWLLFWVLRGYDSYDACNMSSGCGSWFGLDWLLGNDVCCCCLTCTRAIWMFVSVVLVWCLADSSWFDLVNLLCWVG